MSNAAFPRALIATCILAAAGVLRAETVSFAFEPPRSLISHPGNDLATVDVTDAAAEHLAMTFGAHGLESFAAAPTVPVEGRLGAGDDSEVVFIGELVATTNFGPELEGDFNRNGLVEQADLDLVLLNWGQVATPPPGGWINDPPSGLVDQEELDDVLLHWGNQSPPLAVSESSIPEPYTFLLLLLAPTPLILGLRW